MKVLIEINCESIGDLTTHLHVMFKEVKSACKKAKLNPLKDEFDEGFEIYDDNCYGSHELKVAVETEPDNNFTSL